MAGQGYSKFKGFLAWIFYLKQPAIIKGIVILLSFSVLSLLCLSFYVTNYHNVNLRRQIPLPTVQCRLDGNRHGAQFQGVKDHTSPASLRIDNRVLVLVETQYSKIGVKIVTILEANRLDFKVELAGKSLPYLTHMDKGKFGVVVFENLDSYVNMDKWNRELLDKYCREYDVGIIIFSLPTERALVNVPVKGFPLCLHTNLALKDYQLNANSDILRVTRAGEIYRGHLPGEDWTVFAPNHSTYEPLAYAHTQSSQELHRTNDMQEISYATVLQDHGLLDGVQRVFFGYSTSFWLHKLLFLDSLSFLSHGKFSIPLERHILIDIDDIFVGKKGTRMVPRDAEALLASQKHLQKAIKGFHFNLGFSGKYFHQGTAQENLGDDRLLELKDNFWWFPHMWRHFQPAKYDDLSKLEREMLPNVQFAKQYGIPVNQSYAVAPHHSGVYPVHEQLFEAWKKVWNVKATSTEEYPHLRPPRYRRGFIHRDIMVLPRQTCGLFTHTIMLDEYPGGRHKLENSIHGGELFQTFLYNPINVFMTHLSNYGNDRLALYTFESVVKFVQCWTNLQLLTVPPLELALKYFDMYPEEVDPVWGNPCDDRRHMAIWSESKRCDTLPKFLVIGPQKTGTTALYTFLAMHPQIRSNINSQATFEEVQFFNGRNYYKGLDWYLEFFPPPTNRSHIRYFEKSATYFDSELAPERAAAMLPSAKIICILLSPAKRAYSWYQHQRARSDPTALSYTFHQVVSADENAPRPLRELRNRCLNPGIYSQHIERWLDYYSPKQLLILDGEQLRLDPIAVMDRVQLFIEADPYIDYSKKLKYNKDKGFFCQLVNGDHTKCLGRGKGRHYPAMEERAEKFLRNYYRRYNVALSKLFSRLGQPIPIWLEEELSDLH